MADNPLIGWKNLLALGDDPIFTAGSDSVANPIANVFNGFTTRPALPITDGTGTVAIEFIGLNSGDGFGAVGFGAGGFGGVAFGGSYKAELFVLGAARHNPAGYHFTGGNIKIELFDDGTGAWFTVVDEAISAPENKSQMYQLAASVGKVSMARLTISGQAANSSINIPELYLGPSIVMPFIDLGFDPYIERAKGNSLDISTGRKLKNVRYKRLEVKPKWSSLTKSQYTEVDLFREDVIENADKFWWIWSPEDHSQEVYLVQHDSEIAPMPFVRQTIRSFSLNIVEAL